MKTIFSLTLIGLIFSANASSVNSISCNQKTTVESNSTEGLLTVSGNWCDGSLVLVAEFGEKDGVWRWMKDGIDIKGADSNTLNLVDHGVGNYTVNFVSKNGKTNLTEEYEFLSASGPVSHFVWLNQLPIGATKFADNSMAGENPIVGWHWDFGDGTTSTEKNPEHFWPGENIYTVTLTTTDSNGCSNSVTVLIEWKY